MFCSLILAVLLMGSLGLCTVLLLYAGGWGADGGDDLALLADDRMLLDELTLAAVVLGDEGVALQLEECSSTTEHDRRTAPRTSQNRASRLDWRAGAALGKRTREARCPLLGET